MMPQVTATQKIILCALIILGFAGLIGAHEFTASSPASAEDASLTVPFILAGAGTLCFIGAGLMARRLMRGGASRR